jgi:hypothetical protein
VYVFEPKVLHDLLTEIRHMRTELKDGLGAIAEQIRKVNQNLEQIADDNHERLELLHPELAAKTRRQRKAHHDPHHHR